MVTIEKDIVDTLKGVLDKAGMYYRIFSRIKSAESIKRKLSEKAQKYRETGNKMQDIIGIRVVFYFQKDVDIFAQRLRLLPGYDANNESCSAKDIDNISGIIKQWDDDDSNKKMMKLLLPLHDKTFMPERLNIVMNMTEKQKNMANLVLASYLRVGKMDSYTDLIDYTYEIQLRTVLSEGWHEVEHDLRYKTKNESWWDYCYEESRMLNGIYASLETSEKALSQMIDGISYKNYKNKSWDAMLRFHFCRRTMETPLSQELCDILDSDSSLAKELLRTSVEELTSWLWDLRISIPITVDNIVYLVNRMKIQDSKIFERETSAIKSVFEYKNAHKE